MAGLDLLAAGLGLVVVGCSCNGVDRDFLVDEGVDARRELPHLLPVRSKPASADPGPNRDWMAAQPGDQPDDQRPGQHAETHDARGAQRRRASRTRRADAPKWRQSNPRARDAQWRV